MNPTSVDVKDILEAESSLGLAFSTNLFIGREPSKPDDCVTIFDTPGYPPQLTMDTQDYYYPSVQIRVRDTEYISGWNLINAIMVSLHGRAQETWNGTLYTVIACDGEPFMLDWDENNRVRFVCTFNTQRRR